MLIGKYDAGRALQTVYRMNSGWSRQRTRKRMQKLGAADAGGNVRVDVSVHKM